MEPGIARGRVSLRDYQRELAERLRQADSARSASKLGMQVGSQSWLVDLAEAGEILPVPPVTPVPLTRPWFKGVANVRGNLYSVVDFAAFLGEGAVAGGEQARLLLIASRVASGAALLVDRVLGLRNPSDLRARANGNHQWARAEYDDTEGRRWTEIDLGQLVRHPDFLDVAS
jgi:twitching motility protein PilI